MWTHTRKECETQRQPTHSPSRSHHSVLLFVPPNPLRSRPRTKAIGIARHGRVQRSVGSTVQHTVPSGVPPLNHSHRSHKGPQAGRNSYTQEAVHSDTFNITRIPPVMLMAKPRKRFRDRSSRARSEPAQQQGEATPTERRSNLLIRKFSGQFIAENRFREMVVQEPENRATRLPGPSRSPGRPHG